MRRATNFAVAAAASMIAGKLGAWLVTDSVSLLSSLADSVMDVLASLINLFAVRQALQPADREHRFGHGKAEPLAGLGQAVFITASAIFLIVEAVGRIMEPEPIERAPVGIGVMVFAILVTTALVAYQRRVVRLTGSTAIKADSLHYASDILTNIGVIAALALAMTVGWGLADPIIAIAIAGVIIHAAVRVAWSAIEQLMDHELPEADRERIRRIVLEHPEVLDCHDLRGPAAPASIPSSRSMSRWTARSRCSARTKYPTPWRPVSARPSPTRRSSSMPTPKASRSPCRASPGADPDRWNRETSACRDGRAGRWDSRRIGRRRGPRSPPPTRRWRRSSRATRARAWSARATSSSPSRAPSWPSRSRCARRTASGRGSRPASARSHRPRSRPARKRSCAAPASPARSRATCATSPIAFVSGAIDPERWQGADDEAVIADLLALRGVGRWTAEMVLIFYLQRPDVLPLADIGVRRAMGRHYGDGGSMEPDAIEARAECWRPWRSVAVWHLWRSLDPLPVAY